MYYNGKYNEATNKRLDEIIDELNALSFEYNSLGPISLEMALDYRADAWEGAYEDYPEPTPEEIEAMRIDAERNCARAHDIDDRMIALRDEYEDITGVWPHFYDVTNTYARSLHE